MSTVIEAPHAGSPPPEVDERFVLWNVGWETYETFLKELEDRAIRLTFDGNHLELMSPSRRHEVFSYLLGRFIDALTLELNIDVVSGGSMTFKRKDLLRGLEPDECYWIKRESQVRDIRELNFEVDPPPDLVIEVDISRSSLNRQEIYARLGVPELWRYDGSTLCALVLHSTGVYRASDKSLAFPFLTVSEMAPFLAVGENISDTTRTRRFLEWVRAQQFSTGQ
jgi:Uma2 family endonuclease